MREDILTEYLQTPKRLSKRTTRDAPVCRKLTAAVRANKKLTSKNPSKLSTRKELSSCKNGGIRLGGTGFDTL